MANRIYAYISISIVIGFSIFMWYQSVDAYVAVKANTQQNFTIMDTQVRILHFVAKHDPVKRWHDTNGMVLCPECWKYLRDKKKMIEDPVVFASVKGHKEFREKIVKAIVDGKLDQEWADQYDDIYSKMGD